MSKKNSASLNKLRNQFTKAVADMERDSEAFWNSLTDQQRLDVFCAVSRRIFRGEVEEQGSYRYVLYTVFGFGPEAYVPAQVSG